MISSLGLLAVLLALWSLTDGKAAQITLLFRLLRGEEVPAQVSLIILHWRLPRIVLALLIGAALGVSGAIFQSLLRNPLGSPDIMGFNTGAWSGVLLGLALYGQHTPGTTVAAMAGGMLTSLLVWGLSWRDGISTFRLIIVGIGLRAMLVAFNTWLLLQVSLENAISAGLWHSGSLNGLSWDKSFPAAALLLLSLGASALLARPLRLLEMGDDSACALGVCVERSRLLLMLIAVLLTAGATALSGPISFIALVAPHIARRLSGNPRWGLFQAALCGGVLLLLADVCAQRLFRPYQLPVGLITVSLGGIYLIALLLQESRKQ